MSGISETIEALGGAAPVARHCGVGLNTVYQWRSRGWMPGYIYIRLSDLAAEQGVELDPDLFKLDRKPWMRRGEDGAVAK